MPGDARLRLNAPRTVVGAAPPAAPPAQCPQPDPRRWHDVADAIGLLGAFLSVVTFIRGTR